MFRFALICLPLFVAAPVRGAEAAAPSFLNEVVPVLTKQGCSQGSCHGKGAGQNGFRLSLRGYAPDQDFRWLTREFDGRRLDAADPSRSLLLLKATGQVPHEGGRLFGTGDREFQTLLAWLSAGAPGPNAADAKITKLEVTPGDKVMAVGQTEQLTAWATFSDGSRRDVTWLTKFETNDAAVAGVSFTGQVKAKRNGATAIRAAFLTEVAVATFAVPFEKSVDPKLFVAKNNFVDEHVFAKLRDLRIEPSDLSPDEEFIRRAFLDTTGTLPTADEVRAFTADTAADKRAKLIDALLARPEFVDYWTLFLGDLFQNRKERDHDVRGVKGVRQFHEWLRKQVAVNRPWDELARDVLTATGKNTVSPAVGYYIVIVGEHNETEKSEVAESVAQAFLGTRIGCARCHNHPLEKYTQDDFYHFAAYFSRVKLERKESKQGPTTLMVAHRDPNQAKNPVGVNQPRTGQFMKPQPLDRSVADVKPTDDPRAKLAGWMTDPKNEFFAGAMVNRVWRHLLGVGLVEPVDDLRATNPPTNPALWAALKQEFVGHKYDLKHLIRVILNSRAYQLTSATKPGNETDSRFYSHYYARRLPAEVLLDALTSATGVGEKFDGYPEGVRAVQIPDPHAYSQFLKMFGSSERVTSCACERNGEVTLPQLLNLQNGDRLLAKLRDGSGALAKLLKDAKSDDALTEELFLRTLSRRPTADEQAAVKRAVAAGDPRDEVYRDLFWALLNAKSFAFNH
ncbi:DUF1549 domain-containing protein [Fimbriiglobus ruber]|uniref:BIG2 domain-containing protein n=1 Tax=Fimbriiglobus ruber TaxID=1908690 RepID=A0A225D4T9_9BACT|nr:DUF1549 domain-containing protein [Fimbriiglobus ruber]OWK36512.1 hypothetical protein FRUB_09075 [Fimbriiglobus ruber]